MKLSQKKTCEGCRAIRFNFPRYGYNCSLEYEVREGVFRGQKTAVPAEPCPKPKTNMELCEAPHKRTRRRTVGTTKDHPGE